MVISQRRRWYENLCHLSSMKSSNSVIAYLLVILGKKGLLLRKDEETTEKECPLCGFSLPTTNELSLCPECIKSADCCVGLEKIREYPI